MDGINQFSVKKIISGVILLLLLISLPAIYYLVTQTQIFKPKASAYDIGIVPKSGVSIIQENGQPVIETTSPDEFEIKITSPIDTSRPGSDAGSILDNFKLVKEAYASHVSPGTEFCDFSTTPSKALADKSHFKLLNSCERNPTYNRCVVYGGKALCAKADGDYQLPGGGIGNINKQPEAAPQGAHPASRYHSYCGGRLSNTVYSADGVEIETCIVTTCREYDVMDQKISAACVSRITGYNGGTDYYCKDDKSKIYTTIGLPGIYQTEQERICPITTKCKGISNGGATCTITTAEPGESSPQPSKTVADPTVRYGCENNTIIARSYRGNVLTFTEKTECDSNETCQVVQNDLGVVTSAFCNQNTPGVTPPVAQQACDLPGGGRGVCSKEPDGQLKPLTPIVSPRRETGAASVCGKQCVYSQGDSCYSGNCKDGSQNCGFNDNCGYSPSCSSGAIVACPASGSTTSSSPTQTGGANTGGSATTAVDEFADHSLDGKRSAYTCAEGPLDAEKPEGSYVWKADCSRKCMYNNEKGPGDPAGCPKNTTNQYVNPDTSNWCYGFKDGNRCMQLEWTGTPAVRTQTLPVVNTQTIASAPATPGTPAVPATPARSANPAPVTPAQPANPDPATPVPPTQPNNAGRKTTHYRVTADPSRPNAWDVYVPGGVKLPYGFPSSQPGTVVFLYIQFKDNLGNIFNANPYPIKIKYASATTSTTSPGNPAPAGRTCPVNSSCCTQDLKTCGTTATFNASTGIDTSCPVGYQWCFEGYCINQNTNPTTKSCSAGTPTVQQECTPSATDYANCRSCGGDGKWVVDYGLESDKTTWCACAVKNSGAAFAQSKGCAVDTITPPAVTCKTDCNACTKQTPDKCGNTTYDTCDYSTCTSASSTYRCYAGGGSGNSNCVGSHPCGSICGGGNTTGGGSGTGSEDSQEP